MAEVRLNRFIGWLHRLFPDHRVAKLTRDRDSARSACRIWEKHWQESQLEVARLRASIVDIMSGSCELHSDLPYGEFFARGGGECGVCLTERLRAEHRSNSDADLRG